MQKYCWYYAAYCVTRHSDRCHMVQVRDNGVSLESSVVSSWTPDDNSRPSFGVMR